jgi:cobalt-zinc-cadmium efflux system outer membrane protein
MRVRVTPILILVTWCASISAPAVAQTRQATENRTIGFDRAIALALIRNPSLVVSGYQIDIGLARLQQAKLAPNPDLKITVENAGGSGRYSGFDAAETTIALGWLIERGKLTRRIANAQAGVSLIETEREIQRLNVAAETARAFLECLYYEKRLEQTSAAIDLARSAMKVVARRVNAGRSPTADLARAEAELSRMDLAREEIEHQLLVAIHRLAAQWGERKPSFSTVVGNLNHLPTIQSYEQLVTRIMDSPDQQRFLGERRLREAEISLAERNARPSWTLSAGVRRFEITDNHAFVAELNFPLAVRNRNQGRIAEARSALELTEANQSVAALRTEVVLFAVYQELQHSLHEAYVLKTDILPKVEHALKETERAYEAGRYSFFELSTARSELLDAQNSAVQAAVETLQSVVEIERLTGLSITSSLTQSGGAS